MRRNLRWARGLSASGRGGRRRCEASGLPRRRRDEAAGRDDDRFGLASDLESQLAFEEVERVGMVAVNVRAGYAFARCVPRLGNGHFVTRDEDADLALALAESRLPLTDHGCRSPFARRVVPCGHLSAHSRAGSVAQG
jgi:hypothetical protein